MCSRLVETDTMGQDLHGGIGSVASAGYAKLDADIVGARHVGVASEGSRCEVRALLGLVLDEGGRVKVSLGDHGVAENSVARLDGDWNSHVHALLCRCEGSASYDGERKSKHDGRYRGEDVCVVLLPQRDRR